VPNIAVIDAGPLVALFDKNDSYHEKTKKKLKAYRETKGILVTTWPVITEVTYLLQNHVHYNAKIDLFEWIKDGGTSIFPLDHGHLGEIIKLQKKYADYDMDFADASVLVGAEYLETNKVFSTDFKDFSIYRTSKKTQFNNLMS